MHRTLIVLAVVVHARAAVAADIGPGSEPSIATPNPAADAPVAHGAHSGFIKHSGWYVAPTTGVTTVKGEATMDFGIRGAWLINRRFGVGLAAVGWANGPDVEGRRLEGGYGGAMFQYVFASGAFAHATTQTVIGGGAYCGPGATRYSDGCETAHGFFSSESTLNLELNVAENLRLTAGGGFRFAVAGGDGPLDSSDLRGFIGRTAIEFGEF